MRAASWGVVTVVVSWLLPAVSWAQPARAGDDAPVSAAPSQLLEVTGTLALQVESLDESASALTLRLEGMGARLRSRDDGDLTFEVPVEAFHEALQRAAAVGVELRRSVQVRDRTPGVVDTEAALRSTEATRDRIAALHRGLGGVKDPLRVEGDLAQWEDRVAQLRRRLEQLRRSTSLAVLHVTLLPTTGYDVDEVPSFRLPFPWLDRVGLERLTDLDKESSSEPEEPSGGIRSAAQVDGHLKVFRAADEGLLGGNETAMSVGTTTRGVGDTTPVGFALGLDLEVGGGFSGGFLYEYRMLAGLGTGVGDVLSIGVLSGFGLSGVTGGYIPFGVDVPVEAFAAVEVGDVARAGLWARSSWILGSEERQDGSERAPFGDELASGVSLLFGAQHGAYDHERTGLSLAGSYREVGGTHGYEVSLGIGVSFLELERY